MQMQGPTTGACSGAAFQNDGNDITIADSNESPPERLEKRFDDAFSKGHGLHQHSIGNLT